MNKQQIIDHIESRWAEFNRSLEGFNESQMNQPGPDGGWSIKDILAHVRAWEEEALKALLIIVEGKRLPRYKDLYGGINAFNAMIHEKNKDLPLDKALKQLEETHNKLLGYLQSIPEDQFDGRTRFRRRLAADTYNHYPEHTETINELRN